MKSELHYNDDIKVRIKALNLPVRIILCLLPLLLLSVFFCSCSRHDKPGSGLEFMQPDIPISGDTATVEVERPVSPFNDVYVYDARELKIITGDTYSLHLSGAKCYVDSMLSHVSNSTLMIKYRNRDTHYRRVTVTVTLPQLDELEVNGCGRLSILGRPVMGDNFYMELRHVDNANLNTPLTATNLTISLTSVRFSYLNINASRLNLRTVDIGSLVIDGTVKNAYFNLDNPITVDRSKLNVETGIDNNITSKDPLGM